MSLKTQTLLHTILRIRPTHSSRDSTKFLDSKQLMTENRANVVSQSRRTSLTLSTTWGEPISPTPVFDKRYHRVTSASLGKYENGPESVQTKRISSAATAVHSKETSCPFHYIFSKNLQSISAAAGNSESTKFSNPEQTYSTAASTVAQSTIKYLVSTVSHVLRRKRDKISRAATSLYKENILSTDAKSYSAIPGPRGLPFLGSVLEYSSFGPFSPKEFHKAIKSRHSKYGKIFKEKFLSEEFVYTSDPDDLHIIARNEGSTPYRPSLDVIVESRTQQGYPVGITAVQGDEWGKLRSAVNSTIMKPKVVRSYVEAQKQVTDDFVEFIRKEKCPLTGEIPKLEVWFNRWALESIAVILLDTRLGLIHRGTKSDTDPTADRLRKAMDVFFDYGARLTFGVPIWKLWTTKDWKIFRDSQRDEFECAGYYVDKKLEEIQNLSRANAKSDQASSFLEQLMKNTDIKRNDSITLCLELLAGGIDTTANAITFLLYELSKNQDCQQQLRDLLIKDSHDEIPALTSESSRYLRGCLFEALRLHPLTFVNMRKTPRDLVLSGYKIPAGTVVRYTQHLMHTKSEEYFLEPEKFVPDRWVDRSSPYRCKKQFVFTPFGHGARQCPGRRIAEQEVDLLIRAILLNFRVEYHHEDIGTKVRLFNNADKPAKFSFHSLNI